MPFNYKYEVISRDVNLLNADMKNIYDQFVSDGRLISSVAPHDSDGKIVGEVTFDSEGSFEAYNLLQVGSNEIVTTSNIVDVHKINY